MSEKDEQPLSELTRAGWDVVQYQAGFGGSGLTEHCFHLRRNGQHKVLVVRKKMMGSGVTSEELDL